MPTAQLIKHRLIEKKLKCETGLHIGGSKDDIEIGVLDSPIIRDPVTKLPYIPGSSVKGKLRSLLEQRHCASNINDMGDPCECGLKECTVCLLFGQHGNKRRNLGPSRLIARDAFMTRKSREELADKMEPGMLFAEVKHEVSINRKTGTASAAGPRPMERVPAGAEFHLRMTIRIFEGDDENKLVSFIEEGLEMLKADYLGGSGTRGYGKVDITDIGPDDL